MVSKILKISVVLSFVGTLIVNGMASTTELNGVTTAEVSDRYFNFFVPAGYVFSIWGIIYLFLILFSLYQLKNMVSNKLRFLVIISNILNAIWIYMWHFDYLYLSVATMLALLLVLIAIYLRVREIKFKDNYHVFSVNYPFSIYLGWISVATIANISAALTKYNWNGFGFSDETWAVKMVFVAAILGLVILITQKDKLFNLVIIWALFGIFINFQDSIVGWAAISATVCLLTILLLKQFKIIFKQ